MLLRIFKTCNIIIRSKNLFQKFTKRTCTLWKVDDKIVLQAFINERAFLHFLHTVNIVVTAANDTYHCFTTNLVTVHVQSRYRKCSCRLNDNRTIIVQPDNCCASLAFRNLNRLVQNAGTDFIVQIADTFDSSPIHKFINCFQGHYFVLF
ncbi:hypothetical protein D1872_262860 [compost metagenome]